jgi:hypothetical protein
VQVHVNPNGTSEGAANGSRERPYRSIQEAQLALRTRSNYVPYCVRIASGIYTLSSPLTFGPIDSGGSLKNPIVYVSDKVAQSLENGTTPIPGDVVLQGSGAIWGWQKYNTSMKSSWNNLVPKTGVLRAPCLGSTGVADCKALVYAWLDSGDGSQQSLTRARHPNKGYFPVTIRPEIRRDLSLTSFSFGTDIKAFDFNANGAINSNEQPNSIPGIAYADAYATIMQRWTFARMKFNKLAPWVNTSPSGIAANQDSGFLQFQDLSTLVIDDHSDIRAKQNYFYFENLPQALDTPGEWYFDSSTSAVYFRPKPEWLDATGKLQANFEFRFPRVRSLISIRGGTVKPVQYLIFSGIEFRYSGWNEAAMPAPISSLPDGTPMPSGGSVKSEFVPGAVEIAYTKNVQFSGNTFRDINSYGIRLLGNGNANIVIEKNTFKRMGAGAVNGTVRSISNAYEAILVNQQWPISKSINVINNTIAAGCLYFIDAPAIAFRRFSDLTISGNTVKYYLGDGIEINHRAVIAEENGLNDSLTFPAGNNKVTDNVISEMGRRNGFTYLNDKAGIHTFSNNSGSKIYNNHIDTIFSYAGDMAGIYLDEGANNVHVSGNVVDNPDGLGLLIHNPQGSSQSFWNSNPTSFTVHSEQNLFSAGVPIEVAYDSVCGLLKQIYSTGDTLVRKDNQTPAVHVARTRRSTDPSSGSQCFPGSDNTFGTLSVASLPIFNNLTVSSMPCSRQGQVESCQTLAQHGCGHWMELTHSVNWSPPVEMLPEQPLLTNICLLSNAN